MKKIIKTVFAVVIAASLLACGPTHKLIGENKYSVRADDFNTIPILQFLVPNFGCSTAEERFDETALKLCHNGFDVTNKSQTGGTSKDPLCVVFGEIACRAASSKVE